MTEVRLDFLLRLEVLRLVSALIKPSGTAQSLWGRLIAMFHYMLLVSGIF